MTIFSIDPGPTHSAFVIWDGATILAKDHVKNCDMRAVLSAESTAGKIGAVICEQVCCYGMAVGADILDTAFESGTFKQCCGCVPFIRVPRIKVKAHICHAANAKDPNVTAALVDRFGNRTLHGQFSKGTKRAPGFFYGFASHHWAAFALAVTSWDLRVWETDGAV